MKTIYKYPIKATREQVVMMPQGAELLTVQVQGEDTVCLWALVDTKQPPEKCIIYAVPTGDYMPQNATKYIGTVLLYHGSLVFHVFTS